MGKKDRWRWHLYIESWHIWLYSISQGFFSVYKWFIQNHCLYVYQGNYSTVFCFAFFYFYWAIHFLCYIIYESSATDLNKVNRGQSSHFPLKVKSFGVKKFWHFAFFSSQTKEDWRDCGDWSWRLDTKQNSMPLGNGQGNKEQDSIVYQVAHQTLTIISQAFVNLINSLIRVHR